MTRDKLIEAMARAVCSNPDMCVFGSASFTAGQPNSFTSSCFRYAWQDKIGSAHTALAAIEASGYVVVPREPTVEMEIEGTEQWLCEEAMEDRAGANYRAMIKAGKV